jgi:hypothetical protein
MGLKVGNVIQAKAVAVGFGDNGTTVVGFNLPPNCQIVGVRCGGPAFFGAATTLTVTAANASAGVTAETPVAIASIAGATAVVTMDLDSAKVFTRLGVAQTIRVAVGAGGAVAGDLAVVVEYM